MRMIQKLSLIYGYEYNTEDEVIELWIAAASAAGVDLSRDLLEKNVVNRLIPRIIQQIAAKASTEFVEKWSGRVIPVASSLIGGVLNYYFVRGWGNEPRPIFSRSIWKPVNGCIRRRSQAHIPMPIMGRQST